MNSTKYMMTFDVEEYYHANYSSMDAITEKPNPTNLESNIDRLIELCAKYQVKSTCFVLAKVAEEKPQIVRKLLQAGHDIASHGYNHDLVYNLRADEFDQDLKKSIHILEDLTGKKILGYRAPSWSVKKDNLQWYYPILEKYGLQYSSSIYPAHTFLYGIPGFAKHIHIPEISGRKNSILEIPVPVTTIFKKEIGFSGGFYFRFFPLLFIRYFVNKKKKKNEEVFFYLHPREIDKFQPRLHLPALEKFIHYYRVGNCYNKLESLYKIYGHHLTSIENLLYKEQKLNSNRI